MILVRFAVNRPVAALMFYLGICMFGILSWYKIPRDLFPKITTPNVTVFTDFSNAAPEEVETMVSRPVEEALATISGLRKIRSVSREGLSMVTAEFSWKTKADFAALKVRQKIDLIKEQLPRDCGQPVIKKLNPFEMPAMILSVSGDLRENFLLQFAEKSLKDSLMRIDGVASILLQGGRKQEVAVEVDPGLLRARNLNLNSISESLKNTNINYPAGTTKENYFEYLIRTEGEFKSIKDIADSIISSDNKSSEDDLNNKNINIIRLKDIADVSMKAEKISSISRFNGKPSLLLSVYIQSDANIVAVAEDLSDELTRLSYSFPEGVNIATLYDKSVFIKDSIKGLKDSAVQGGVLAFIVLLIFLQSFRAAVIVGSAIPVSILSALMFMYKSGMTLNMMSLGGLALGTGMLVDNAIVVMENIVRKAAEKNKMENPAVTGTTEVWTAILASTLTTVAVFLPLVFLSGLAGQLFGDLALTVTFSLASSLVVSLTLIPRLARNFKSGSRSNKISLAARIIKKTQKFYISSLKKVMKFPALVLSVLPVVLLLSFIILKGLPKEMIPALDDGQFIIALDMPPGTMLSVTDQAVRPVEDFLLGSELVKNVALTIASNPDEHGAGNFLDTHQSRISVVLRKDRTQTTKEFIKNIEPVIRERIPMEANLRFKVQGANIAKGVSDKKPLNIILKSADQKILNKTAAIIYEHLRNNNNLLSVHSSLGEGIPETKIQIDDNKAAILGVSTKDISLTAKTALKGTVKTKYRDAAGNEYPVRVKLKDEYVDDIGQVEAIPLWVGDDTTIFLGDVAELENSVSSSEIIREDQEKTVTISAGIKKGAAKSLVLQETEMFLQNTATEGVEIFFNEVGEEEQAAVYEMIFTVLLSIILVYMIMAAQFESIKKPLLIMVTVPLALIGVALALWLTGTTLNTVSVLGVVLLAGIVVNNGIVLIDYINQSLERGEKVMKAVIDSASIRFRPILMTTMTTLLGLLPLAMGIGAGQELRAPMAVSVIGGLLASTILTLYILPVFFIVLHNKKNEV